MPIPILTTKLYIPSPRSDLVSRPRLLERLQRGAAGKLTLVSAPAGYGKTTLLSEWISQAEMNFAWISLDEDDNDLNRFLAYLLASLTAIPLQIDPVISASLDSSQSNLLENLLVPLINQISALQRRFALVLDDYHQIKNQEVHQAMVYLLDNLPRQMHLVVATRTDPPLRFPQLRAGGQLCEIRAEDLKFTTDEALQFLNQNMGLGLTSLDVTTLFDKTEGWIAGLQLAAISLQGHQDQGAFIRAFAGDDRYIADYLLDEALGRQATHIQTFLLQTSILERLCASLCNALTGRDDSQTILEELERANLFLVPLDNQRNWYRYHHLFSDLLRLRLSTTSQTPLSSLHLRASIWYENQGLINDALKHALLVKDLNQVSSLVEKNLFTVAMRGDRMVFLRWVSSLPDSLLCQNFWLSIAAAWALIDTGQLDDLDRFLEFAEQAKTMGPRQACYLAAVRANRESLLENHGPMIRYAREALDCIDPEDIQLYGMLNLFLGKGEFWAGNLPASEAAFVQAYTKSLASGDTNRALITLSDVADIQMMRGQITKSHETLQEALSLAEKTQRATGQPVVAAAHAHSVLAVLFSEKGDYETARYHNQENLQLLSLWGQPRFISNYYSTQSLLLYCTGDIEGAFEAIQKAQDNLTFQNGLIVFDDLFKTRKAYLHLLKGELEQAACLLEEIGLKTTTEVSFRQRNEFRTLATLLIARGEYQAATQMLNQLIDVCLSADAGLQVMKAQILKAKALYLDGDPENALESLKPALELAAAESLFNHAFLSGGEPVAQLLYQAALNGIYPEFCNNLLEEFATPVKPDKKSHDDLVEPLSDREIEVLKYIADGMTNQEIAGELVLSLYTVKSHARNIFSKLGVKNRTEAVARARLLGLLPHD